MRRDMCHQSHKANLPLPPRALAAVAAHTVLLAAAAQRCNTRLAHACMHPRHHKTSEHLCVASRTPAGFEWPLGPVWRSARTTSHRPGGSLHGARGGEGGGGGWHPKKRDA